MATRLRVVPEAAPRAVGYVRVSDEGGRGDDLLSPEIQARAIRDYCAARGYDLVDVLEDIDLTGRLWRRRQIENAVARVESGDVDVIVVWKVSRVSRNRKDWAIAVDRVEQAGGRLESATEPLDTTTSTGRFARGMLAELAAFESERIGDTWREVHAQRTGRGLPHSAPARLGYTYTRAGGYQLDPETVDVVRDMYERYCDGASVGELAAWLRAQGVRVPKTGSTRWTKYGVQYFLDSGFAAGLLQSHDPDCRCGRGGSCANRVRQPGAHPPIIDLDLWALYERARQGRRGTRPARKPARLTGCVICAGCRHPMQLQGSSGRSSHAYVCRQNTIGSAGSCPAPAWLRRDTAEAAVEAWLPTIAAEVDALAADLPAPAVTRQQRDRLTRKVAAADAAMVRLITDNARNPIPAAIYDQGLAELASDRERLVVELEALPSYERLDSLLVSAKRLMDVWVSDPVATNRLARELVRVVATRGESGNPKVLGAWEVY